MIIGYEKETYLWNSTPESEYQIGQFAPSPSQWKLLMKNLGLILRVLVFVL